MSPTEKQIRANRANAQKSAGPKTPEGKNTSRRNAFTHGSYARDLIIESPAFSENEEDYDLILTSLIEELQPEGVFQEYLVRKIANCLWRSQRALRAETAHVNRQLTTIDRDRAFNASLAKFIGASDTDDNANSPQNRQSARSFDVNIRCIPMPDISPHLLRYEMRLDRQLTRAYKLLAQLKKLRSGKEPNEIVGPMKNEGTNPILHTPDDGI